MEPSLEELKSSLKDISQRRTQIEQEIAVRTSRLDAAGVGMAGSLVDREGFPRADVDISAIRADRQRVITLSNDHKALSAQLEQLLHRLHSVSRHPGNANGVGPGSSGGPAPEAAGAGSSPAAAQQSPAQALGRAFAVVDEMSAGSPASSAGVQLGDQLVRFGEVTAETPGTLQQVAATLQSHEGREVEAVFLRHGAPITLRLVPQQWGGLGLLGCHLRPL